MFIYVKNVAADADLMTISGTRAVAISWWWERIAEFGGRSRYLGLSLMFSFILYAAVGATEFVSWVMYMFDDIWFARWYFRNVGYWGSVIIYMIPPMFAFIQIVTESTITFPGSWAIFQFVSGMLIWGSTGLIHIYFIDDFVAYIDHWDSKVCVCTYPIIYDEPQGAEELTVKAWEYAKKERATICAIQCPPLPIDCKLKRKLGDTDDEYRERCEAAKRGIKQGITRSSYRNAAGTAEDEEEEVSENEGSW